MPQSVSAKNNIHYQVERSKTIFGKLINVIFQYKEDFKAVLDYLGHPVSNLGFFHLIFVTLKFKLILTNDCPAWIEFIPVMSFRTRVLSGSELH